MGSMNAHANIVDVARIKWKLPEYLEQRDITAYKLGAELGGHKRIPAVYRLINKTDPPSRVDFQTLANVIQALKTLTGEDVALTDLLEYEDD
jgi:hypothetical protein